MTNFLTSRRFGVVILRRALLALMGALLVLREHVTALFDVSNRYFLHWSHADGGILIGGVVILAVGLYGGYWVLQKVAGAWAARFLAVILGVGLIATALLGPLGSPWAESGRLLLVVAAMAFYQWVPKWRVAERLRVGILLFSPLVVLLFVQVLMFPTVTSAREGRFGKVEQARPPVYFFIFDAWSYYYTFPNGEVRESLPNLRRLADQSHVFHHVYSANSITRYSIPGLLYQVRFGLHVTRHGPFLWGDKVPPYERESFFSIAKKNGYRTAVAGFYLSYAELLGPHVDDVWTEPYYMKPRNLWEGVKFPLLKLAQGYATAWCNQRMLNRLPNRGRFYLSVEEEYQIGVLERTIAKVDQRLDEQWGDSFFLFSHHMLPHSPFVYYPDGSLKPINERKTLRDYVDSIGYVDALLGRWLEKIPDNALIVVTSDHSLRTSMELDGVADALEPPGFEKRVPLLVRLPNQKERVDLHGGVEMTKFRPLMENVMEGRIEEAATWLKWWGRDDEPSESSDEGVTRVPSGQ